MLEHFPHMVPLLLCGNVLSGTYKALDLIIIITHIKVAGWLEGETSV